MYIMYVSTGLLHNHASASLRNIQAMMKGKIRRQRRVERTNRCILDINAMSFSKYDSY